MQTKTDFTRHISMIWNHWRREVGEETMLVGGLKHFYMPNIWDGWLVDPHIFGMGMETI